MLKMATMYPWAPLGQQSYSRYDVRPSPQLLGDAFGLGAFEQGVCADGADFVCSTRGGEYSCRPCDFPQLEAFKKLQEQLNRLIVTYKLGNTISVDGRIGDDTTAAAAAAYRAAKGTVQAPPQILDALEAVARSPRSEASMAALAAATDDAKEYFELAADAVGAPPDVPGTDPSRPSPDAGPVPDLPPRVTDQPDIDIDITADRKKALRRPGIVLGGLGLLTAAGLIAAAAMTKDKKRKKRKSKKKSKKRRR